MKKLFLVAGLTAFLIAGTLEATSQQKEKENKGQGNGKGQAKKEQQSDGPGKGANAKDNRGKSGKGQENAEARGAGKDNRGKSGNDDRGEARGKDNDNGVAKGRDREVKFDRKGIYTWTPETFRDRDRIRNGEKVSLCHKPGDGEPGVTINVSANALQAHLDHGDVRGECPDVVDSRYTDDFLRRRTDYYNLLQEYDEQQLYSRSILDYALLRLSGARQELVTLQNSGAPADEIERRQVVVGELEQNASLLEVLLAEAAKLL